MFAKNSHQKNILPIYAFLVQIALLLLLFVVVIKPVSAQVIISPVTACDDKNVGDACAYTLVPDEYTYGTCQDSGGTLMCQPDSGPPPSDSNWGTFMCRCQIGQGEVNCYPTTLTGTMCNGGDIPGGVPNLGICRNYPVGSDNLPCEFLPCSTNVACVAPIDPDDQVGYGEPCSTDDDCLPEVCANGICQSLMCDTVVTNLCISRADSVSLGGQCFYNRECIQMALEDEIICQDSSGGECPGPGSTCRCGFVPPEPPPDSTPEPGKGAPFDYCAQLPGESSDYSDLSTQRGQCYKCMGYWDTAKGKYANEGEKIFTAVGCVQVSGSGLASDLIRLLLGIGGGVALLSIIAAAFKFTISQGDSGKIKEAKELMTASISGLLFIIFSVIILQFIGVEILRIPGLVR